LLPRIPNFFQGKVADYTAKMGLKRQKSKLFLDVAKVNVTHAADLAADPRHKSSRYPKEHTKYVDLVPQLRNPIAAEPMEKWMTTERKVGLAVGSSSPNRNWRNHSEAGQR
jgi:hypothetical protein